MNDEKMVNSNEQNGQYTVKRSKGYDLLAKIIAVLAAVIIWIYAVQTESPAYEDTLTVTVDITNIPSDLSVISGDNTTVELTVRGKKSDITGLKPDDVSAFADASTVSGSGIYSLPVKAILPDNLTLIDTYPETVNVYLGTTTSKHLPIQVELRNYTVESGYTLESTVADVTGLTIKGPGNELDKIASAKVVLELGNITSSMTASGSVVLFDKEGNVYSHPYVTSNVTNVLVRIEVHTYKTIPVTVDYKYGYFNSSNEDITINPATITVKGTVEALAGLDGIMVTTIDETQFYKDGDTNVRFTLPEGVTSVDNVNTVLVKVEHKNTQLRTVTVSKSQFKLDNVKEGEVFVINTEYLNVTLRGPLNDYFANLSSKDITVLVDMSPYEGKTGEMRVPVTVVVSNPDSSTVIYPVDSYAISITAAPK